MRRGARQPQLTQPATQRRQRNATRRADNVRETFRRTLYGLRSSRRGQKSESKPLINPIVHHGKKLICKLSKLKQILPKEAKMNRKRITVKVESIFLRKRNFYGTAVNRNFSSKAAKERKKFRDNHKYVYL